MDRKQIKSELLKLTVGALTIVAVLFGVKYLPLNLIGVNIGSQLSLMLAPWLIALMCGLESLKLVYLNGSVTDAKRI